MGFFGCQELDSKGEKPRHEQDTVEKRKQTINSWLQILIKDPTKRFTLKEVREHSWIERNKSTEKKLLPIFDKVKNLEKEVDPKYKAAVKQYNSKYREHVSADPFRAHVPKIMKSDAHGSGGGAGASHENKPATSRPFAHVASKYLTSSQSQLSKFRLDGFMKK